MMKIFYTIILLLCYYSFILSLYYNFKVCNNYKTYKSILRNNVGNSKFDEYTLDNPSYFPKSIEELANEASYLTKLGLLNNFTRMRLEIDTRYTKKLTNMLKFIILTAKSLIDEDIKNIYIFMSTQDELDECINIWNDIIDSSDTVIDKSSISFILINQCNDFQNIYLTNNRLTLSNIYPKINYNSNKLFIIHSPNNIIESNTNENVLENIETICFQSALRSIPIVISNPNIITTSWNHFGYKIPLLLNDFKFVFMIRDDYAMLNRKDHWLGLTFRLLVGYEIYILKGCTSYNPVPNSYAKVKSWGTNIPDDLSTIVKDVLINYSEFLSNHQYIESRTIESNNACNFNNSSNDYNLFSWRNTKPAQH